MRLKMDRPKRYGFEDITTEQQEKWEAKHGEYWADTIMPEQRTTIWDFDTLDASKKFAASNVPSGYFGRAFERTNVSWDDMEWTWSEKEIQL